MAEKLIINARRQLDWRRRILSDVTTLVLWGLWIYLWLPVFRKLAQVIRLRLGFEPAALEVLDTMDPIDFSDSLTALLGTTALLLLWTLLPKRQVTKNHIANTLDDYAQAFHLSTDVIVAGRNSRVATVHHDDEGAIVRIEPRS